MKRDDTVYLQHILDAISRIESYMQGVSEEAFQANPLVQDGVIRQLGIIGEAVRQLSRSVRERYPNVAWQDIAGMRNKLIHNYLGVDLEIVWQTVKEDLPELNKEIQAILRRNKKREIISASYR